MHMYFHARSSRRFTVSWEIHGPESGSGYFPLAILVGLLNSMHGKPLG